MKRYSLYTTVFITFVIASCQRVTVVIDKLPANTPSRADIHIAGNFNHWDPGDRKYQLIKDDSGNYYFTLPRGIGNIEFLITRGDWTTVESDICGNKIENRVHNPSGKDTVSIRVESWTDLGPVDCPTGSQESVEDDSQGNP